MFLMMLTSAMALPFQSSGSTSTSTFAFDWTLPGGGSAAGSTSYSFTDSLISTGGLCTMFPGGCSSGTFITGNGGDGLYSTTLSESTCTTRNFGFNVRCRVFQSLSFSYNGTGALYSGSGRLGYHDYTWWGVVDAGTSISRTPFAGTMIHASGATGTFAE